MSPRHAASDEVPERGTRFSHSLEVGLLIMRTFGAETSTQGIADISERTNMSRSTVHRYTATLAALSMLEQDRLSRRYRVGTLPADIGARALQAHRTAEALDGELQALRRGTGCTARMGVLIGLDVLIVAYARSHAQGQALLGVQLRQGARAPAHCTALGKILLGAVQPDRLRDLLSQTTLARCTARTITGERAVAAQAAQARKQSVAIEVEEHQESVLGIAVPVIDPHGVQAGALSLVAHTPEITMKHLEGHLATLRESARKIGERIKPVPVTRKQLL